MKFLSTIVCAALLGACAAAGPVGYSAASGDDFGYSETRIESDRYRIVYRGSGGMPPEIVEDYALRRAAELAVVNGYDWFRIAARDLVHEERGGVSVGAGFGTGSYGRRGGASVGVGGDVGRIGAKDFFTARLEVVMGTGTPPADGDSYDAAAVINTFTGAAD